MQRFVWERVGRGATVASFKAHGDRMEDAIPGWTSAAGSYYQGDGFQCVHAGLLVDPIEANDPQTMIHDHNVVKKNRYAGPLTITGHIALQEPTYFAGDEKTTETLAYGETLPLPETGVICIDTGCGKGGRLTAMIIKDREYHLESVPE